MSKPSLGDQEHAVLRAVWHLGRCTVRQVFERVGEPQGLAYTTIATVLDRLYAKGFLSCAREGKALLYAPSKRRKSVEKELARSLLAKLLGSDPLPAVATLVDAVEEIDPELLDELAAEVKRRRSRRVP